MCKLRRFVCNVYLINFLIFCKLWERKCVSKKIGCLEKPTFENTKKNLCKSRRFVTRSLNFLIFCKNHVRKWRKKWWVWKFGCLVVIVRQIDHKKRESTQKKSREIRGCSKNVYCSDTPQKSYIMGFFCDSNEDGRLNFSSVVSGS